jgi:hypothetical protein
MQIGAKHVETPFIEFGQISTVLYFSHFLIIVPLVSLLENTLVDIHIRMPIGIRISSRIYLFIINQYYLALKFLFKCYIDYINLKVHLYFYSQGRLGKIVFFILTFFFFVICRAYFEQPLSLTDSLTDLERLDWAGKEVKVLELHRRSSESVLILPKLSEDNTSIARRNSMPNLLGGFDYETKGAVPRNRKWVELEEWLARDNAAIRAAHYDWLSSKIDSILWQEDISRAAWDMKINKRPLARMIEQMLNYSAERPKWGEEVYYTIIDRILNTLEHGRSKRAYLESIRTIERLIYEGPTANPNRLSGQKDMRMSRSWEAYDD